MIFSTMHIANAAVLTFDDVRTGNLYRYGNFMWFNTDVTRNYSENAAVSGTKVAINDTNTSSAAFSRNLFDFNGAYFTSIRNANIGLTVLGYEVKFQDNFMKILKKYTPKYSKTLTINSNEPTWFDADFKDINLLVFNASLINARYHPNYIFSDKFAIDNFTFNEPIDPPSPLPEPSSMVLGLLSLGGLLGFRRKK